MLKKFAQFILPLFFIGQIAAQKGFQIKAKLENYTETQLTLGFYYGEKTYVKDTASLGADGFFTFQADTLLPCGVYLLVTKPDNNFIQVLMGEQQRVTLQFDAKEAVKTMKVKGSKDMEAFYEYLNYLSSLRPIGDKMRAELDSLKKNPADSLRLLAELNKLDRRVKDHQSEIAKKNTGTLTSKIVRAAIEVEAPDYPDLDEKEAGKKKYYWYRGHYFDNLDLADDCNLRGPVMHQKVDHFVNKLVVQHPDTICTELDNLLKIMEKNQEVYKYYLIHFLNFYAKSQIVGFDAIYVHLVDNYYAKGKAPWTDKTDLDKIIDNANRLRPILIGKIAPNITVKDKQNQPHALWDVNADYTVLFFWDPECGHCKKAAPFMVEFAKKFKDRGVKVFAVCTAVTDKAPDCWKSIEEKQFSDDLFLNRYDPYIQSRYKTLYDIRTTPQIFILNRDHKILMKRIGGEQLGQVMEEVMKHEEDLKKENNK